METLIALAPAVELRDVVTASGPTRIRTLHIAFSRATPNRLREGVLPRTYTTKPLVSVDGDAMFGELAIVRWLEKDDWQGVWVDTVHGGKFWRAMPHKSLPVQLPPDVQAIHDRITAANGGKAAGAFDVMAWRRGQLVFLEYEGAGDRPSRNQARWIEAAFAAGIVPAQLWYVVHPDDR